MIRYVVLVKRRADVDRDAFLRRWTEEHAALIARLPGLRRYQFGPTVDVPGYEPGYDGIGQLWFDYSVSPLLAITVQSAGALTESRSRARMSGWSKQGSRRWASYGSKLV